MTNQCRMHSQEGKLNESIEYTKIADNKTNAKLKVHFFWPFKRDYWIIYLDRNYQYAIISKPDRKYLWILFSSQIINRLAPPFISSPIG